MMDAEKLAKIIEEHRAWLANRGGCQADLRDAGLRKADLRDAILRVADLRDADLREADLRDAILREADLRDVMFSGAVGLCPLTAARLEILPRSGEVRGWKKCRLGVIVELVVPDGVERSNAAGRKCRARQVRALAVHGANVGLNLRDGATTYRAGEVVECDRWDADRWVECGGGIHFYLTREEAEAYVG